MTKKDLISADLEQTSKRNNTNKVSKRKNSEGTRAVDKNAKERLKTNFSSVSASKMVQPMQIMMDILKEQ